MFQLQRDVSFNSRSWLLLPKIASYLLKKIKIFHDSRWNMRSFWMRKRIYLHLHNFLFSPLTSCLTIPDHFYSIGTIYPSLSQLPKLHPPSPPTEKKILRINTRFFSARRSKISEQINTCVRALNRAGSRSIRRSCTRGIIIRAVARSGAYLFTRPANNSARRGRDASAGRQTEKCLSRER